MARRRDDDIDPQELERLVEQEKAHLRLEKERLFLEVQRKLDEYVAGGGKVLDLSDQMHNQYISWKQAECWSEIEGDAGLSGLEDVLRTSMGKVSALSQVRSIVENGVGNGKKAARVYDLFNQAHNKKGKLHGIDISALMISKARKEWSRQGIDSKNIPLHRPVAFEDLGKLYTIEQDPYYTLHLFLGQTIGNFDDPVRVVKNIAGNMKEGEYLLAEWFCREPKDYKDPEGKFEKLYRELFSITGMPLGAIGNYNPHIEVDNEGQEWNVMSFTVRDVPKEKRTFTLNGKTYTLRPETEIKVSRSRRFKEEEVVGICEKAGLEGVVLGESEKNTDRRYGLFKKKKDRDSFSRGIRNGIAIAAGVASLFYLLSPYIQTNWYRHLWRNADIYQAERTSVTINVEHNLHELRRILEPSCEGVDWRLTCTESTSEDKAQCEDKETTINYTRIRCNPKNRRDPYLELEYPGDFGINVRLDEIKSMWGIIPRFKRYGAVRINEAQILLLEKSNVRIFVQLLEDARREIVQKEASGPKERYRGNDIYGMVNYQEVADRIPGVITFFSKFLDIDGSQIAFKLYQADIGSECGNPRLKDGYFALDFEKGDTFEARIHHFYNPSIVARGVYTWHSGGTVHTDPDGPAMSSTRAMSCTATFAINTHRSKARNDDAARHIVDILQTVRSKYENQKGTGPH